MIIIAAQLASCHMLCQSTAMYAEAKHRRAPLSSMAGANWWIRWPAESWASASRSVASYKNLSLWHVLLPVMKNPQDLLWQKCCVSLKMSWKPTCKNAVSCNSDMCYYISLWHGNTTSKQDTAYAISDAMPYASDSIANPLLMEASRIYHQP